MSSNFDYWFKCLSKLFSFYWILYCNMIHFKAKAFILFSSLCTLFSSSFTLWKAKITCILFYIHFVNFEIKRVLFYMTIYIYNIYTVINFFIYIQRVFHHWPYILYKILEKKRRSRLNTLDIWSRMLFANKNLLPKS